MTEGYYEAYCGAAATQRGKSVFVIEGLSDFTARCYEMLAYAYDHDDAYALVRYYRRHTQNPVRWRRFDP